MGPVSRRRQLRCRCRDNHLLHGNDQEEIQTRFEGSERRKYTVEHAIILPVNQSRGHGSGLLCGVDPSSQYVLSTVQVTFCAKSPRLVNYLSVQLPLSWS